MNLDKGQPVILGIRPEHLAIVDQPTGNAIPCHLDKLVKGVTTLHSYYYAVNDQQKRYSLEYRYPGKQSAQPEKRISLCYLYFDPHHLVIMPVT